jgi:hypothetical protein
MAANIQFKPNGKYMRTRSESKAGLRTLKAPAQHYCGRNAAFMRQQTRVIERSAG